MFRQIVHEINLNALESFHAVTTNIGYKRVGTNFCCVIEHIFYGYNMEERNGRFWHIFLTDKFSNTCRNKVTTNTYNCY